MRASCFRCTSSIFGGGSKTMITCHFVSDAFSATELFLQNINKKKIKKKKGKRKWRISLINIKGTKSFMATLLPGYQCRRVTDQQSRAGWLTLSDCRGGESHGIAVSRVIKARPVLLVTASTRLLAVKQKAQMCLFVFPAAFHKTRNQFVLPHAIFAWQ